MRVLYKIFSYLPKPIQSFVIEARFMLFRIFGRPRIALESTKSRSRRERERFFDSFCHGRGLDVGYGGDLLTKSCKGWDIEHGDAQYLKGIKDSQYDFVYSSHTLEHMKSPETALMNWWRVLKTGGFLILYIPHRDLYEKKKKLPSRWNLDHKHFFLLDRDEGPDTIGLVPLIERTLTGYEIVYAQECAEGHTITEPEVHSNGEYSIEAVIKKI
jgi:SAM-dependent methyltransferase